MFPDRVNPATVCNLLFADARENSDMVTVGDIMSRDVFSVNENASVQSVGWELNAEFFSGAPVVDDNERLVGVVSKTDIIKATLNGPTARQKVREIMTRDIETIGDAEPAASVIPLLLDKGRHRVIVVNGSGGLVGLVTPMDVLKATARYFSTAPEQARLKEDGWYAWSKL